MVETESTPRARTWLMDKPGEVGVLANLVFDCCAEMQQTLDLVEEAWTDTESDNYAASRYAREQVLRRFRKLVSIAMSAVTGDFQKPEDLREKFES